MNQIVSQSRLWLMALLMGMLIACSPSAPEDVHLSGRTMGTTYNVKYVNDTHNDPEAIQTKIDALLVHVNKLMSTYDPTSELSTFNQFEADSWFDLDPETFKVMAEAKRIGALTGGVLDVTVGPLVNLWGFGPDARPEKAPDEATIEATRERTGLDKLHLQAPAKALKVHDKLYVDLSTIAKGYGVDAVAELLEAEGLHNYLVEIGGEMRVAGNKASGSPWRIAIEKPVSFERAVQDVISIGNNAVATSGDYRNYFEEDGIRYSHIIDPITGKPIQNNVVSTTVILPSCMTADGMATAFMVMGKEKALALAAQENMPLLLITRENGEFKEYTSPAFAPYLQK